MKATVIVRLKEDVLDSPGRGVTGRLHQLGFNEVKRTRVGKVVELELDTADRDSADRRVRQMCERLLANPVIEEFELIEVA